MLIGYAKKRHTDTAGQVFEKGRVTGYIKNKLVKDQKKISFLDAVNNSFEIIDQDELPGPQNACVFKDGRVTVDATLLSLLEDESIKEALINEKKDEKGKREAEQELIDEGVLNPDGSIK